MYITSFQILLKHNSFVLHIIYARDQVHREARVSQRDSLFLLTETFGRARLKEVDLSRIKARRIGRHLMAVVSRDARISKLKDLGLASGKTFLQRLQTEHGSRRVTFC